MKDITTIVGNIRLRHGVKPLWQPKKVYAALMTFLFILTMFMGLAVQHLTQDLMIIGERTSNQGQQRLLVIPVCFPDLYPSTTLEEIEAQMVRIDEYYRENTYGRTWITFTIVGWIMLDQPVLYYGLDDSEGDNDEGYRARLMIKEAITKMDPVIDYRQFDKILIFHAGYSEQSSGVSGAERHKWLSAAHYPISHLTQELVLVETVSMVSEYMEQIPSMGTIAHELGHDFGAEDLYDPLHGFETDLEDWGLMSTGNWLNDSQTPCHMCLYTKLDIGFIDEQQILPIVDGTYKFEIVAQSIDADGYYGAKYIINEEVKTYYLIEARRLTGFDSSLEQAGIVVTLINESLQSQEGRVLLAPDPRYPLDQRAYGPGEYYIDPQSGFGIRILNETQNGYLVEASSEAFCQWRRSTMIEHNLIDSSSGSMVTTGNGTMFFAVEGQNATTETGQIEVYKSTDLGHTWNLILSTMPDTNRTNPIVVVQRESNYNLGIFEHKPFLFCEAEYSANHTIEAWDLTSFTSENITDTNVDARSPSVVASSRKFYLAFEVWNITLDGWENGSVAIAFSSGYSPWTLRFWDIEIWNASNPCLSALNDSDMEPFIPVLTYTKGLNYSSANEVYMRHPDSSQSLLVYSSPSRVSKPRAAMNRNANLTLVIFENWTLQPDKSWQQKGLCVMVGIDESELTVLDFHEIPVTWWLSDPPLVEWGISPFGFDAFYVGTGNGSVSCILLDEHTRSWVAPVTLGLPSPHIIDTHVRVSRWMAPTLCEIESYTAFTYSLTFAENADLTYEPIYVDIIETGPPYNFLLIPISLFIILLAGLLGLSYYGTGRNWVRISGSQVIAGASFAITVLLLLMVNYLLAGLFASNFVQLYNFVICCGSLLFAGLAIFNFLTKEEEEDMDNKMNQRN
ncbi:MAG: M6 family metalloprotease domain-containing protein [Candidatus Thorarchaeota archaeon]|nr:M6 family metalloprotease domain-containing protein [Candidatus Thorarchaeota archaeon]